jgi:Glycosyl transferase family 2
MATFSIVIPTRDRPDTLQHALSTVLRQSCSDIEIVVQQANDSPGVDLLLTSLDDPRIRAFKTGGDVWMTENWDAGIANATGEWITIIHDDDGFLPDGCAIATRALAKYNSEILMWRPPQYFWPNYPDLRVQNRLMFVVPPEAKLCILSTHDLLNDFYRFRLPYWRLPMIYNSFVKRTLIERIRARRGCYIQGTLPDVASGIVNAWFAQSCVFSTTPLSVTGTSHHSVGYRIHVGGDSDVAEPARRQVARAQRVHPTLVPSWNISLMVANEMLAAKDNLFPHDGPKVDYHALLCEAARFVNTGLDAYDAAVAELRSIAAKNGIDFASVPIPPPSSQPSIPPQGARVMDGQIEYDLDGAKLGFATIADAVRLVEGLLPITAEPVLFEERAPSVGPLAVEDETTLQFSAGANGLAFLTTGWHDPEHWGVWSAASAATLRIPLAAPMERIAVFVYGRACVHPGNPTMDVTFWINHRAAKRMSNNTNQSCIVGSFEIGPTDLIVTNEIALRIEVDRLCCPAEDGVGTDTRYLGLGLEKIVVRPVS